MLVLRQIQTRFAEAANADLVQQGILFVVCAQTLAAQMGILGDDPCDFFCGQHTGVKIKPSQVRGSLEESHIFICQFDTV